MHYNTQKGPRPMFPCRIAAPFPSLFHISDIPSGRIRNLQKYFLCPEEPQSRKDIPLAQKNRILQCHFSRPEEPESPKDIPLAKKTRNLKKITLHLYQSNTPRR